MLTAHFTGTSGTPDSTASYYMGGQFEVKDGVTKKYYSIAGMMIAVNDPSAGSGQAGLQYLLTDHLGSTVAVTNSTGTLTSQQRYLPFGAPRTIPNSPILGTDFTYTGQRKFAPADGMGGIMDYKARFYSPALGRFIQPDSIIPDQSNPQSWNRFSYVVNNPTNHIDPTGQQFVSPSVIVPIVIIAAFALGIIAYTNRFLDFPGNRNIKPKDLLRFPQGPGPGGQWDPNKKSIVEKLTDEARLVRDLCKVNMKTCLTYGVITAVALTFTITLETINPQPNNLRCAFNSNDPVCIGDSDESEPATVTATATATAPATATIQVNGD